MRAAAIFRSNALRACAVVALLTAILLRASASGDEREKSPTSPASQTSQLFETKIAPLLARHCLECHDAASAAGQLDLSRKSRALAGGESGPAFVAGSSADSLLWQYVESDEMPQDREPLSAAEKKLLREWIDAGADWSLERIDPEAHRDAGQSTAVWLQRLTVGEYIETVRSTVGVDIEAEARRLLPADQRADGFTNTAYNLSVDLAHVEAYSRLAKVIVSRVDIDAFAAKYGDCDQLNPQCMRQAIRSIGKRLFRGPLRDEEVDAFLPIATVVKESGGDFREAVAFTTQAMLQSPRFVFRLERQRGDGTAQPAGDYELASRMSYTLWGAPPDDELMQLADAGQLNDAQQIEKQVARMLRDPRAVDRSLQFATEWLNLDRLDSLQPNPERFPEWNAQLAADMRLETEKFFEDLVWHQQRPLWELLNAQFTYATPRLAYHYGLFDQQGASESASEAVPRVAEGLQTLYTFQEGHGETVRDVSGSDAPIDLTIADPSGVRWRPQGLDIHSATLIASEEPPARLVKALKHSRAVTLEAWVTPVDAVQAGPARIVTLSGGPNARNFTLGQEGDSFQIRLRTTETSGNGMPALSSKAGSVAAAPIHVVYTRDASGKAVVYVDGQPAGRETVKGNFSNWEDRFLLAVGNELSKDRLWKGTLHLVAVYDRALSEDEVRQNHAAGAGLIEDHLTPHVVDSAWQRSDKQDLLALYRFDEGKGDVVRDRSPSGAAADLHVEDRGSVKWGTAGLAVYDSTLIATPTPPRQLINAVKKAKTFSVEAWVTPANASQNGPARILTLSSGTGQRNFTLGQDGKQFDFRVRARQTDGNGIPSLASRSGSARPELTHLVFTVDRDGQAALYVDGERQASKNIGSLEKWDDGFRLAIANETSKDRPWLGTYHLVAIYGRTLRPDEIRARGGELMRYDLTDNPARGGLLTHGSILTIGGDHASMVARGLFVLHDLLDSRVGNPPPGVDTTPVPPKPGMSTRDHAEVRLANPSCAGCHSKFEPLAFGLEKFNGIGGYQEIDEHGNRVREDGEILFPGSDQAVRYETSGELMELLAQSERVQQVMTRKLLQFALGRPLSPADLEHAQQIHAAAKKRGGTYHDVMTAILTSDLIRKTRTETE